MAQFDVFVNPILQARRAYLYVAVLQSDLREHRGQLIAHREAIAAALDYLFLGV